MGHRAVMPERIAGGFTGFRRPESTFAATTRRRANRVLRDNPRNLRLFFPCGWERMYQQALSRASRARISLRSSSVDCPDIELAVAGDEEFGVRVIEREAVNVQFAFQPMDR